MSDTRSDSFPITEGFSADGPYRYEVREEALTDAELRSIISDATRLKNRKGIKYVLLKLTKDGRVMTEQLRGA